MTILPFRFARSAAPRKRRQRSSPKAGHKPTFDRLEERCLLAVTYTTPPSLAPVVEMVYGPASFYPLPTEAPGTLNLYGIRPGSVAIDARGDAWYTDNNAIAMFSPESEYDYFALPDTNDVAASIALGGDGNLWFVENSIH